MADVVVVELVALSRRAGHRRAVRAARCAAVGSAANPLEREGDRRAARPATRRRGQRLSLDGRTRDDRVRRAARPGSRHLARLCRECLGARAVAVRRDDSDHQPGARVPCHDRVAGRHRAGDHRAAPAAAPPAIRKRRRCPRPGTGVRRQRLPDSRCARNRRGHGIARQRLRLRACGAAGGHRDEHGAYHEHDARDRRPPSRRAISVRIHREGPPVSGMHVSALYRAAIQNEMKDGKTSQGAYGTRRFVYTCRTERAGSEGTTHRRP